MNKKIVELALLMTSVMAMSVGTVLVAADNGGGYDQ